MADGVRLIHGDCLEVLKGLAPGSVDAVVTDPPYGLEFMGRDWDHGVPGVPHWQAVLRVLKPGGYLLSFGGTRTYHRLACAVEDAGLEVRDCLMWIYGSGYPKGKGCLKPAWEPILLCRKPGPKVLPLGIDECRVPCKPVKSCVAGLAPRTNGTTYANGRVGSTEKRETEHSPAGRYPANVCHDGSGEVLEAFGERESKSTGGRHAATSIGGNGCHGGGVERELFHYGDTGTAARFFYCAKASKAERGDGNTHPTVKPLVLMRWLVRLVCPEGGLVLDPFAGSGTTAVACLKEGRRCVLVERDPTYFDIARRRIEEAQADAPLFAAADREGE